MNKSNDIASKYQDGFTKKLWEWINETIDSINRWYAIISILGISGITIIGIFWFMQENWLLLGQYFFVFTCSICTYSSSSRLINHKTKYNALNMKFNCLYKDFVSKNHLINHFETYKKIYNLVPEEDKHILEIETFSSTFTDESHYQKAAHRLDVLSKKYKF